MLGMTDEQLMQYREEEVRGALNALMIARYKMSMYDLPMEVRDRMVARGLEMRKDWFYKHLVDTFMDGYRTGELS